MARSFRVVEKKRGERRTGSEKVGSAGEVLFFAIFFLLGCAGLVLVFLTLVFPEWRANHEFAETTSTVLGKRIGQSKDDEGSLLFRPEIEIRYQVAGKTYVTTTYDIHGSYSSDRQESQAALARFQPGRQYPCWYDPAEPDIAILVRGYRWWFWLTFLIPGSFLLIGGGGFVYALLHWGASAERRAAMARQAKQIELFDRGGRPEDPFPNVPSCSDISNSPGTTLRYRLPLEASQVWALIASFLGCLVWNGLVAAFAVCAFSGNADEPRDWLWTGGAILFFLPFVLVGLLLIYLFIRQLLLTAGIGPTQIEISDHPLHPGQSYAIHVSQWGRLSMNSLEILLVAEEKATYRQGTDTRTETQRVHQQQVFCQEAFAIRRGLPFEKQGTIEIPSEAMHSFRSEHNEVIWKLLVLGNMKRWPDYERSFHVVVYPRKDGGRGA